MAVRALDLIIATGLLAGASALAHAGDLYQWKDSKGVTHYSDAPPPKGRYASRTVKDEDRAPPAPSDASAKPGEPVQPADRAQRDQANCNVAQANLKLLRTGSVVGLDANHDGKPDAALSAEQAASQLKLAQDNIALYCTQKTTAATP